MKALQSVKNKLAKREQECSKQMNSLMERAKQVFAKQMAKPVNAKRIKAIVKAVEQSRDLTTVQHDEYYHVWARVDFSEVIDTDDELEKELLKDYLMEFDCINADFENDCATRAEGPCILVNHEGDVLDQDSGKWIISKKDYESIEELKALIEKRMEETGYFPSVISVDYYGNAVYMNTQQEKAA